MKRRVLAWIMTFMIMFGTMPTNIWTAAAETTDGAADSQVGDYYEANDTTGELANDPTLPEGSTEQVYENSNVKVNKTITATETENVFDVNLTVTTTEDISKLPKSPDAAAVIVIDASLSMEDCVNCKHDEHSNNCQEDNCDCANYKSRVDAAKEAAQTFINGFVSDSADRYIAIVEFSGIGEDDFDNYDAVDGAVTLGEWATADTYATTNNTYCDAINNYEANGGTNIHAGMMLAQNLLNNLPEEAANIKNKNIILISDGAPTYSVSDNIPNNQKTSVDIICSGGNYMDGTGTASGVTCTQHDAVEEISSELKSAGVNMYAAYIGEDEINCNGSNCDIDSENDKGSEWLANYCGFTTYEVNNTTDLTDKFEDLISIIERSAQAWIVTDPMGPYVEYVKANREASPVGEFSITNDTLTWDLKGSTDTDESASIFKYELSYQIKLNNLSDYVAGQWTNTNDVTDLSYMLTESVDGTQTSYKEGTAYFNVPSVKGFAGEYEFTKTDTEGNPLEGAIFTLTTADDPDWSMTAESDSNGKVSFTNIPSGHTYTLTETSAPSGYEGSTETHTVNVSYGNVTVDGKAEGSEGYNITVENEEIEYVAVSGSKTWIDNENENNTRPSSITVNLYGTYEVEGETYYVTSTGSTTTKTVYDSKTVNSSDWSWNWPQVIRYYDGLEINWFVEEENVPGYISSVNGYDIINIYSSSTDTKIDYVGTKYWVGDTEDERPSDLTIALYANEIKVENATPTWTKNGSTWIYKFSDLEKFDNEGNIIQYVVKEESVPDGYEGTREVVEAKYSRVLDETPTSDLSNNSNRTSDKSFDIGSDSIGVIIATIQSRNEGPSNPNYSYWIWTSEELSPAEKDVINSIATSRYSNFDESNCTYETGDVTYSRASRYEDYTADVSLIDSTVNVDFNSNGVWTSWTYGTAVLYEESYIQGTTTLTNTYSIDISGSKTWTDNNDQDGLRPESIAINLLADGTEVERQTVTKNDNWAWTFNDLSKYNSDGTLINYTITEDAVTGYKTTVSGYDVTNTHTPSTVNVSGSKTWVDNDNQDGKRPTSITVRLLADGTEVAHQTVTESDGWAWEFANLPEYRDGGTKIVYTITEDAVTGYETNVSGHNVTNTHTPETIEISGSKTWDDNDDQDGVRPESIIINLLADGKEVDEKTVTAADDWKWTFTGLDKYKAGKEIEYTITEDTVANYITTVNGYSVTNTHTPETVTIPVTKDWDDNNNETGKRPTSVTVQLYADGTAVEGKTATLSSDNNWSYEWTSLDKYKNVNGEGVEIKYTVVETSSLDDLNYSATQGNAENNYTITNTYPAVRDISVIKVWEDNENQDGIRPDSVRVQLYADGEVYGDPVTLTDSYTWEHLFKYKETANGLEEIKYTVDELEVPKDYTKEVTGSAADGFTITNTHIPATTEVSVTKVWEDNNDQDGIRPTSVTVQLKADGEALEGKTVTLNKDNNWMYTWTDLAAKSSGQDITYTVDEVTVPTGYTKEVTGSAVNGFSITNTHTPELIDIDVTKSWSDNDNQDGIRPDSVEIKLLANGKVVARDEAQKYLIKEDWKLTFTDLPKYENGDEIIYSVEEVKPDGYTASYSGNAADGFIVTNTHTPEKITISGTKTWADADNQDGIRPDSITVILKANNEDVTSKTVTAADGWSWSFENLDKYKDGKEIVYTVVETAVNGYTPTYSNYDITNTHTPATIDISGTKTWDDNDDQDGKRPESIKINLLADGEEVDEVTVTADDGWKYSFTNLPKYEAGKEIIYTITEDAVTDYTTSVDGYNVTNTHEIEKVSVSGSKTWNDNDDQDGKRPESITINLLADGRKVESKTVTASDNWAWTFDNLDKYANGKEIVYTITEEVVTGYTTSVDGYDVTNTHEIEKTSVSGSKTWDDENNQDGKRPESITVNLLANGTEVAEKTVTAADGWKWSFTDLDKFAAGVEIVYTIQEDTIDGYTPDDNTKDYDIENSYTPEKITVSGSKTWVDDENRDGVRPESITINLLADGTKVAGKTVTEKDGWAWEFTGLDKYKAGKEIVYTITEDEVTGYTTSVDGYNVINTHEIEKTSVSGSKTWEDDGDRDGLRPKGITINLLADGQPAVGSDGKAITATVTEEDGWKWSFTDLPKYKNQGTEIVYTVTEEAVKGYTTVVNGFDVTNTHEIETVDVSGTKTWVDENDRDGVRPESITVNLLADGEKIDSATVTAAEDGTWTYNFENLPKYKDHGTEIVYTITEDKVDNYTTDVDGFSVTNTHEIETTSVSGSKTWNDDGDRDGLRPESITINLLADGEKVAEKTVEPDEDGNWTYSFTNLPKYRDKGTEIVYTVTENAVDGYTTTINGNDITNTHKPETTSVSGSKTWADDDDRDGLRPSSITIKLMADGEVVQEKEVTATNGWAWTFDNLPKNKNVNGKVSEIVYTIEEADVANYSEAVYGYDVTNTHTPEKTSVSGTKTWDDANNQDGKRPASITVNLLADGVWKESKVVTPDSDGNWSYEFTDLNQYRDKGTEIVYTITEDPVADYGTKVSGYNITNSYTPGETSVTVTKSWDDNNDQDGIRPASVKVQLYADNEAYGQEVELNAAKEWTHTWNGLAQKKAGQDITYTVKEVGTVAGYTTAVNGYAITNTHTPETTKVEGTKTWSDNNDQDGIRPDRVTVNLLADGEKIKSETVTPNALGKWSYSFTDLPKYSNGTEIVYTITEEPVKGYTADVNGYDVTNTHSPETVNVEGTKTWNDGNNQDGKRPASITVNLLADGVEVAEQTVTPSEKGNWSYSFTNLPKYRNGGTEIVYTIAEDIISEYTGAISGFDLANTHVPLTTEIEGTKTWADADDQDGKRPESIIVNLLADGVEVDEATVIADANGNWTYSFTDLPVYAAGKMIDYTITEDTVAEYTTTVDGFDVTNTHTPETVAISGTKTWDDADDQDGKRPESITVNLLANNEEIDDITVKPDENGEWTYDFGTLPKYENGKEILYTITEDKVENYTSLISGYNVTNKHTPETVEISGSKTWDDADDQDGKRPESITINLLADGQPAVGSDGKAITATVTEEDGWKWSFTDLPKYSNGTEIVYTITEDKVDDYTTTYDGYNVKNSYTPGETSITVTKAWQDGNNQDGVRPDSVQIQLLADGTAKGKPVTLNADNSWTYTWTGLPEMAAGKDVVYTVVEPEVPNNYTVAVTGSEKDGFTVTNTRVPEEISISGSKTWNDANDQDGKRPTSITINLLADGKKVAEKTVTEGDGWAWKFENMPKYKAGTEIVYAIEEDAVEGYTAKVDGFNVTNTHEIETIEVSGTKTWSDADNQDGKRPQSVTIRLLADGKEVASTTAAAGDWTYKFTDLPKYREGKVGEEIVYTITEDSVEGYTTSINGYDVTNTHTPETITVEGAKTWDDANDQDGVRPDSVKINLLADGVKIADKTVSAANSWKYQFTDLDKYKDGKLVVYTVTEEAVENYTPDTAGFNIENTHTPGKTSVSVSKVWDDNNNQDGIRAGSVTVKLLADGTEKETVVLSSANDWTYTWNDLDEKSEGEKINYTVEEIDTPEGYTATVTGSAVEGYTITNEHTPATVDLAGSKTWDDADNQDGKRPDSITINLLANGIKVDSKTVDVDDSWAWNFEDMPKFEKGEEIVYVIQEVVIADYTTTISAYDVTNTHIPETTSVHVAKSWNDDHDRDGLRPDSITIDLLADGKVVQTKTTTASDNWAVEFTNLPVYEHGKEITYTVEELAIDGYTTTYKENDPGNFTVTNTHETEKTSVSGKKTWEDKRDQDGKRPTSITVYLLANGEKVDSKVVTADDGWKWEFTDLNLNEDGEEITYTVKEEVVPYYTSDVDGYEITNTYVPETIDISGTKTWDDADDQDGKRPTSITVKLLADGKEVATKTVTSATDWKYIFEGMAKYKNGGKLITYTVEEEAVAGYTSDVDGYNITNSYTPETVDISGTKTWDDSDDQDGKRPESITINLLADGKVVDTVTVDADDDWSWSFTNLPKYEDGKMITYATSEVAIGDYSTTINGFDVTNTHAPEQTSVSVSKVWDDADNQDGIRPAGAKVQLLADGDAIETVVLDADNSWAHTWSGLDMYADGEEIKYTVREVDVPAGYEAMVTGDAKNGYVVTNTHEPATTVIEGGKTWADVNDQDGKRPDSITVLLLKNGVQIDSQVVSGADDWEWAFTDLPEYEAGSKINYAVEEVVITDYETSIDQNTGEITNRHDPELTFVQVAKTWEDNYDQDGIRPDKVTINLYADGKKINSKFMNEATGWTTEFTNLPKYKDGELIEYTITEDRVKGYETDYVVFDDYIEVINTHEPEVTAVSGNKIWDDADDQDGKRPDQITVNLYADGQKVDYETVTANNNWAYSFDNLPKYDKGEEITYTIGETPIDAYQTTIDGFDITNSYEPEKIKISGSKTWNDADDQDGKRPDQITVHLRVNGQIWDSQAVTAADNWEYEWTGLSKYYNGKEVNYTVTETPIPEYTTSYDGANITNSYTPGVVSVPVTKGWKDLNDLDGIRPDSIDVELFANGETTGKTLTLSDSNGWTSSFDNLDEYANGEKIKYTVKEVGAVEGYTSTVSGSVEEGFTILNVHEPEQIEISGTKTWKDADDQDGKRPESITVKLLANGYAIDSKEVTAADNWSYSFGKLNKYYGGGKEIKYEVVEAAVSGYGSEVDGFNVTNTHEPETRDITGSKTWDDNFDQDGMRPDEITVKLLADGEVVDTATVTEKDGWAWAFEDVPVYAGGEVIEYTVEETAIAGYEATVEGFDITNTHEPETTEITGSKTWDDSDDQDGKRPDQITVHLLADGEEVATDIVDARSNWTWFFEDMPVYADGEKIEYTVAEESVEGYEPVVTGFDITNVHEPETTDIEGSKTWNDADDQDGMRPEVITVNLLANGEVVKAAKVTIANAWTWTFKDMPVYEDGEKITYTIEEESVEGYTSEYDGFDITNTHTPETVDVSGSKTWDDADNQDGIRPDEIKVRLLADGVQIDAIEVTEADDWSWNFKDLPKYKDGVEIVYTVTEDAVENYGPTIEGFNITNAYTPAQTSVTVTKAWDDANNQDGVRPEFVEVQLYADGVAYDAPKVLYAENDWTYTWTELDMNEGGEPIDYTVEELDVDEDLYKCEITGDAVEGYIITNVHKPEMTEISGAKTWADNDDQDGMRPDEITVKLLANGDVVDTVTVTEEDGWSWIFKNMPVYEDGKVIEYTVEEEAVEGYETVVDGFDITNVLVDEPDDPTEPSDPSDDPEEPEEEPTVEPSDDPTEPEMDKDPFVEDEDRDGVAQTGDESNMMLYLIIALIAAAVATMTVTMRRKTN